MASFLIIALGEILARHVLNKSSSESSIRIDFSPSWPGANVSIHVALNHVTHYRYDRRVQLGPQIVRLRPCVHARMRILSYALHVEPKEHFINWQQDAQGNYLARLTFPDKTDFLKVSVDLVAEMSVFNPFDFFLEPVAQTFPFEYEEVQHQELAPYLQKSSGGEHFTAYLSMISRQPARTIDFLVGLNQSLSKKVSYLIRLEPGVQTPEITLKKSSGSCRDSAWLLVQLLRHMGLAARFVSGYLIQLMPDVRPLDGPAGPASDFTDLHAWCEVYLPGAGWIGLDPTSGLLAGEGHIPLACSPEPTSAAPISGRVEACNTEFSHRMKVERVWESPRVTQPYTEDEWQKIVAVGYDIDRRLDLGDVRLTMGGEPTFVGTENPDAEEWNTSALGEHKRKRANHLFQSLREHYAPHGLMHVGQGKWYPGEPLPRWSLNCFWRRDGEPLWQDSARYADETEAGEVSLETAHAFLMALATRLGTDPAYVFHGYEDVYYYLWRERKLPVNVDPLTSNLKDELERKRLAQFFERGLQTPKGSVLPLQRREGHWLSGSWFLRQERCYLVPGDSPMGYRLPLDSLPWVKEEDYPYIHAPDPGSVFSALPAYNQLRQQLDDVLLRQSVRRASLNTGNQGVAHVPRVGESASGITRSALCVEPRDGHLYVFMPPLADLDAYLELVTAVESCAAALDLQVLLEGYEPPADPRLINFRVTPDPGVIEVNVHPAANWHELVERTTHLYEQARVCHLTSEKFMMDGRHSGTGGGNHFVLGAATVQDSPFLRRPDLLRSLLSYWHNHPSLSYLFSGLFIGPTSQAPRVDEARNDAVYELDIAFQEMNRHVGPVPPWLTDRWLRNLLVDVTGNTHRTEFCIDKLYSPDSATGRLGLLELRAFEMPPHARMSLVQQLFLRAMVVRFWEQPYTPDRLVRWGTQLHDRFLLPHFIEQDFSDVLEEMKQFDIHLEASWFAPHREFRFPKLGDFCCQGIDVELRHALEPWHVMGEEGATGGTVRYVDSSLERLQIKVRGMITDRYQLLVNQVPIPLHPTGTAGEYVAGVRYRAWQPASALHPTIGIHAPLVFDLYDTWMRRSLGGCQYHVVHPGGRSYDQFPVNAFEAESRRLSRFFRMGHTPGQVEPMKVHLKPEMPLTLDLRCP